MTRRAHDVTRDKVSPARFLAACIDARNSRHITERLGLEPTKRIVAAVRARRRYYREIGLLEPWERVDPSRVAIPCPRCGHGITATELKKIMAASGCGSASGPAAVMGSSALAANPDGGKS